MGGLSFICKLEDCVDKAIFDQTRKKVEATSITCITKLEHPSSSIKFALSGLLLSLEVFKF